MKNKWSKAVNDINKKRFVVPEGWSTREEVAEDLQCAPDKVADLLKPGLQSNEFEKHDFNVWDEKRRMTVRVTCYRMVACGQTTAKPTPAAKPTLAAIAGADSNLLEHDIKRVQKALMRRPHIDDRRIAMNKKLPIATVRAIRDFISKA